jgi:hypothetical protein
MNHIAYYKELKEFEQFPHAHSIEILLLGETHLEYLKDKLHFGVQDL